MNNQIILYSLLIFPWLTLFFMKKEDVKRYMPVALLSSLLSMLIFQSGETLKLWVTKETIYPLRALPHVISLNPVAVMWIFKFTYRRFILFLAVELVMNLGFAYFFLNYFLQIRGIIQLLSATPLHVFLITTIHGFLLYAYFMWQESIYAQSYKNNRNN